MIRSIPLFIVLVSVIAPIALARRPNPRRALRTLYVTIVLAALVWCSLCLRIYPRYVWPE